MTTSGSLIIVHILTHGLSILFEILCNNNIPEILHKLSKISRKCVVK